MNNTAKGKVGQIYGPTVSLVFLTAPFIPSRAVLINKDIVPTQIYR